MPKIDVAAGPERVRPDQPSVAIHPPGVADLSGTQHLAMSGAAEQQPVHGDEPGGAVAVDLRPAVESAASARSAAPSPERRFHTRTAHAGSRMPPNV